MGADAKRRLAILLGILLYLNGCRRVQGITENHLLCAGVNAQRAVFLHDFHQLPVVVPAVHAQALEQVGKVLRKIQAENVPPETVVKVSAQCPAERVAPEVHGNVVCHLRTIHAPNGANKFVRHRAHGQHIVLHGKVHVARTDKPPLPLPAAGSVLHCRTTVSSASNDARRRVPKSLYMQPASSSRLPFP